MRVDREGGQRTESCVRSSFFSREVGIKRQGVQGKGKGGKMPQRKPEKDRKGKKERQKKRVIDWCQSHGQDFPLPFYLRRSRQVIER